MSTMGVILSIVGDTQCHGDIMMYLGNVMMHLGGYHDASGGYHDASGGYHEYHGGCSILWGENLLLFEYPHSTEHPHGAHDISPHVP